LFGCGSCLSSPPRSQLAPARWPKFRIGDLPAAWVNIPKLCSEIGQPGGCLRGASCLAAARCQDLPETLFAPGASRHQVQLVPPAGTSWQAGG